MQPSNDRHDQDKTVNDRQETVRRVTVPEAAQILQTTPDAVRSRLRRGKLRKDVADDGTVLVVLNAAFVDGHNGQADGQDRQTDSQTTEALVGSLQEQIEFLRQQLQQEREANRENRRLLAAALERIPAAIEAPASDASQSSKPRESAVSDFETEAKGAVPQDAADGEIKPSFWRRLFGG